MFKSLGSALPLLVFALACSAQNGNDHSDTEGGSTSGGTSSGNGGTTSNGNGGTTNNGNGGASNGSGGATSNGNGGTTTVSGGSGNGGSGNGGTPAAGGSSSGGASKGGTTATNTGGAPGKGGTGSGGTGTGGTTAKGGTGSGGASKGGAASGGAASGGATSSCTPWPTATTTQSVSATIPVSGVYDGGLKKYVGSGALGGSGQEEGQDPIFELANGATLKNVIIGSPAADGIHCKGTCTLQNVWWEDVGEDAATFLGTSDSQTMTIDCGGAKAAADKVLQHNGPGTFIVKNFWVSDFGKLYRSCGNCSKQYTRHVQFWNIVASTKATIAGINKNYKDTAEFHNVTIKSGSSVCDLYDGNSSGDEPTKLSSGNDGTYCIVNAAEIHTQ